MLELWADKGETARAGIRGKAPDPFTNGYTKHFNFLNETVHNTFYKTFTLPDLFHLFVWKKL